MKMGNELSERWDKVRRIWEIIDQLRGEGGCPWDRKQTPESVQTYLVEEAHEASSAVRAGDHEEVGEELGDLLFMVFFMVHLYEEKGSFRLEDVCDLITEKMVRRHPHVFGETTVRSVDEVRDNWEKIKAGEKAGAGKEASVIPESLPALMRAYRMVARLAQKDPGWDDPDAQAREYALKSNQLCEAIVSDSPVSPEMFGEVLLQLVNLARIKKLRAEDCLHERLRSLDSDNSKPDPS
jgi:MazG family protein